MALNVLRALPPAQSLPKQIGRYEIISSLGVGGMARVYLGLQRGPGGARKLFAIKQVRAEIAADEQVLAMFVDEARIALGLSHPNVVNTFEVVAEPGEFYMVLEYLEGQSLAQILRRVGRTEMPRAEHLWLLTQVLTGLHYAHTLADYDGTPFGIVHRDVSPSNVFVTYTGQVKLVDFGIAKASGGLAETQHGIIKGKLGYAAPEQCLGRPVDARSDVYAVGVMLWEALALRRRAVGETPVAMIQARVQDTEARLEEIWPEVPPKLAEITRRALAVDPARRFSSAAELLRELESAAPRLDPAASQAHLAALLAAHFEDDAKASRRAVEEHLNVSRTPVATSPISEQIPLAESGHRLATTTGAVSSGAASLSRVSGVNLKRTLTFALPLLALGGLAALALGHAQDSATTPSASASAPSAPSAPSATASAPSEGSSGATQVEAPSAKPGSLRAPHAAPRPFSASGSKRPSPSVSPAPEPLSAPAKPAAPSSFEPGADLGAHTTPRTTRRPAIDESDPYPK